MVLVPLLTILFGIVVYGLIFLQIHSLTDAAADGARAAVPQTTATGASTQACNVAKADVSWMPGAVCDTPVILDECSAGDTATVAQGCPSGETVTGEAIRVVVHDTPMIDLPWVPEPSVLSYTSTMTLTGLNQSGLAQ